MHACMHAEMQTHNIKRERDTRWAVLSLYFIFSILFRCHLLCDAVHCCPVCCLLFAVFRCHLLWRVENGHPAKTLPITNRVIFSIAIHVHQVEGTWCVSLLLLFECNSLRFTVHHTYIFCQLFIHFISIVFFDYVSNEIV